MEYDNILKHLEDISAEDIKVYDVSNQGFGCDYFIIATVNIRKANAIYLRLKKDKKITVKPIEGKNSNWLLIDTENIIIHLFTKDERIRFALDDIHSSRLLKK